MFRLSSDPEVRHKIRPLAEIAARLGPERSPITSSYRKSIWRSTPSIALGRVRRVHLGSRRRLSALAFRTRDVGSSGCTVIDVEHSQAWLAEVISPRARQAARGGGFWLNAGVRLIERYWAEFNLKANRTYLHNLAED
jgi:hypothetical protein